MTLRRTYLLVVIFTILTQPLILMAQTRNDWARVKQLSSGTTIEIDAKSGKKLSGLLDSVSDSAVTIMRKGTKEDISATEIRKLHQIDKGTNGTKIAISTAVGAGVGAAIGAGALAATGGSDDTGGVIAPFFAVGAGIGALVGIFSFRKRRTLVYEAN